MEGYINLLKEYLKENRSWTKNLYRIEATLYRGVTNGRFTYKQGMEELKKLKDTN